MTYQDQMRKGTTAVILLHLLAELGRPVHGYEVIKELQRRSEGGFDFKEGLVYPRLHELERQGYLRSYWQESGEGRRRKYYEITDQGRQRLAEERREWRAFRSSVDALLGLDEAA
ncbi:MAG: PadR family transcriptional regulator [Chloroflexi bacterium]|nr:PadR family transcriptional regulator [Chloroflexota bacterium]